jgi:hypothetical protein
VRPVGHLALIITHPDSVEANASAEEDLIRDGRWLGTSIHQVPTSDECVGLAKRWINTCLEDHDYCPKTLHVPLPKRVVNVGSTSQEPFLEVGNNKIGKYAALSYCWGKTKTLKTEHWNMDDHKKQIPMRSLPRSLQDAVTFTRRLGIQYLWIDALCIIQDDPNDWEEQSAAMYDIYRHSHVTISATSAQDSDTYWLEERSDGAAPVKLWDIDSLFHWGRRKAVYLIPQIKPWDYNIDRAPISERAWTLQERVLSPRVLHFGIYQMVLECQTCTISEAGNDKELLGTLYGELATYVSRHARKEDNHTIYQFKRILTDDNVSLSIDTNTQRLSSRSVAGTPRDRMLLRWYKLLENYTTRSLTKKEDKLVALLGITDFIRSKIQDEFVAGLWREDMHRGLCWTVLDTTHSSRPSVPRSPSWSWAAVDGKLKFADKLVFDSSSEITVKMGVGTCTDSLVLKSKLEIFRTLADLQQWGAQRRIAIYMDIVQTLEAGRQSYTAAYVATMWRDKSEPDDIIKEYDTFYLILVLAEVEGTYRRAGIARSNHLWAEPTVPDPCSFEQIIII